MRIYIVQPYITNYRLPVFKSLAKNYNVTLSASIDPSFNIEKIIDSNNFSFKEIEEFSLFSKKLFWQKDLIKHYLKVKPELLFLTANPRYVSTWVLLILSKFSNKKIFLHGQGLYSKEKISLFNKLTYFLYNKLSTTYICYTQSSKESLKSLPIYNKCKVAENSIINDNPVKKQDVSTRDILFIGRLRKGSNVELLIKIINNLNETISDQKIRLHIVGGGENLEFYKSKYSQKEIIFYGAIYDNARISEISKQCIIGCYPGDAGLSVLHYMSLSLPVIVHSDMKSHMGPEASYVVDKYNGFFFKRNDFDSLKKTIENTVLKKSQELVDFQKQAFHTYEEITNPSLSERIGKIIKESFN